jgi:hypothetical protein
MARTTRVSDTFAAAYPNLARWVRDEGGYLEIGPDVFSGSFIRALDAEDVVWEGADDYPTLDAAFADAEANIAELLADVPPRKKAPAAKKSKGSTKKKAAVLKLIAVDSSMLSAVGYDEASKELVVVYNSGATWRYGEVPKKVFKELLASGSKGSYMRSMIIGAYPEYRASR